MSDLRLSRKDAAQVKRLLAQPRPCLLRGAFPADYNGFFKPELWSGTPGKVRLMGYALCHTCYATPDVTLHVEGKLMADLVGRRN